MKTTDTPIADHIEDVLDMVAIGAGSDQPYEQFVGLNLIVSQPVTICHKFKGGDILSPPLLQMLDSALWKFRRVCLESMRRGH